MRSGVMVVALIAATATAEAGELLRLKSGTVSTQKANKLAFASLFRVMGAESSPRHFVVQFETRITRQHHQRLRAAGVRALRYLPDDALVISASAETLSAYLKNAPDVRAVLPFEAGWKLSPDIVAGRVFGTQARAQVWIRLFEAFHLDSVSDRVRELGGEVDAAKNHLVVATVHPTRIEHLSLIDGVEWIQMAPRMEMMRFSPYSETPGSTPSQVVEDEPQSYADLTGYESGTRIMNFEAAWGRGYRGAGQMIAYADSGMDRGDSVEIHSDVVGRVAGRHFGLLSSSWEDPDGHGTHVGGSIAGGGVVSGGRIVGAAPEALLIAQGMWSPFIGGLSIPPRFADFFEAAYIDGARVHSNSWVSPRQLGAYDVSAAQVDEFMFEHPEMLLVFSAGNSGVDLDKDGRIDRGSVGAPGTAKNVLTVGASENLLAKGGIQAPLRNFPRAKEMWGAEPLFSDRISDNPSGLTMFSSRGPTLDGRIKPDVVAPGSNILSLRSHHPDAEPLQGAYDADYAFSSGTSMSTPLVAGAAGIVRQYLAAERSLMNPSAALVKNILMHSSVDLFPGQFGLIGKEAGQEILSYRPNADEGWGRVDVSRAIALSRSHLIDEKAGVATGENMTFPWAVESWGRATISLVWTDAPGAPNAAQALVNDLDLALVDSAGVEVASVDRVNNFELIEREIGPGQYTIVVRGTNVPQGKNGKQPFALVATPPAPRR